MAKIPYELTLKDDATRVYNQFVRGVSQNSVSMSGMFKGVGLAIGAAFSIDAMAGFMKAAAESQANVARLDAALASQGITSSKTRDEMLDLSNSLMKKAAVDDDVITNVQATIVALTGDAEATRTLTPLVLDLARGLGMEAEEAAKLVAKTIEGSDALSRYGIKIGETSDKQERLAKISAELTQKFGGQAAAFANTDMGRIESADIAIDNLQESLGQLLNNVLIPIVPALTNTVDGISSVLVQSNLWDKSVSALVLNMYKLFGMTDSYYAELVRLAEIEKAAAGATDIKTTAVTASTEETKLQTDRIKELKKELDLLTPGTDAYTQKLYVLTVAQNEHAAAVKRSTDAVFDMLNPRVTAVFNTMPLKVSEISKAWQSHAVIVKESVPDAYQYVVEQMDEASSAAMDYAFNAQAIVAATLDPIKDMVAGVFNNEEAVGKNFFKAIAQNFISLAQTAIAAYTAIGIAMGIPTFGASIPASLAIAAGATTALEIANQIIGRFHEGGRMGAFGERIPLGADERPAILRVGETVRTREQEERLQSPGNTVVNHFHFEGSNIANAQAFKEIVEKGMRELGVTNAADYFRSTRAGLILLFKRPL